MNIVKVDTELAKAYEGMIPDLFHSTGPSSYDYQFGGRALFDSVVRQSWYLPDTLFSHDACHLALDDDNVAGFLLSFHAPEFRPRGMNLAPIWPAMIASGEVSDTDFSAFMERVEYASWLNAVTRPGVYYIHAIASRPAYRGKGVGVGLLQTVIEAAKELGHGSVELDVLSDNPAVGFYKSQGFEVLVESKAPKPFAAGVPVEYRMALKL